MSVLIARTTYPSHLAAVDAARRLIETGVVACAQVGGPVTSVYRWEGKVTEDTEWVLTLKFAEENAAAVEAAVHAGHPYSTPQWLAWRADRVSPGYAAWVRES